MEKKVYKSYTNILFPKGGFWKGYARVIDLLGNLDGYNESDNAEMADKKAIYSDWLTIGNDLRNVMEEMKHETR